MPRSPTRRPTGHELALLDVRHGGPVGGARAEQASLALVTDRGEIACLFRDAAPRGAVSDVAVLWVFGAGGGFHGPAGGLYDRIGSELAPEGVASLQVAYRRPAELVECVLDVLVAVAYLADRGRTRVVLVGHSFGGAVVITVGTASDAVVGVAALSSQTAGTGSVAALAPRPLFVAHGTADEILPDRCARDIYARAGEPKRLALYPDCAHGLDACRDALDADLLAWLREVAGLTAAS